MMPMIILENKFAVDTNILIYLFDQEETHKRLVAQACITKFPKVSSQVVSELINVVKRKLNLEKHVVLKKCAAILNNCEITPMTITTLNKAIDLIKKYQFQIFDAMIVASALEANCTALYSEDLQHNLVIENTLRIINPFI